MGARVYCLAAYRAHPPRRRRPARPVLLPPSPEQLELADLRAEVRELRAEVGKTNERVSRLEARRDLDDRGAYPDEPSERRGA